MTGTFFAGSAKLELPDGFVDQTIHTFIQPLPSGMNRTFVVAKQPVPDDKSILDLVDEIRGGLSKQLPRFQLVSQQPISLGGLEAVEFKIRWAREGVMLFQAQAYVRVEGYLVAFTLGAPLEDAKATEAIFSQTIKSLKFRRT